MLKKFKDLHRDLQNALEDTTRKYRDECTTLHLQVTEPCPTWYRKIVWDLPSSIRDARKEIISLAIKLGFDPDRELR